MAQQVKVILVDDFDGGPAEETIRFTLDGTSYEIDLNGDHALILRSALEPFVRSARKTGRPTRNRPAASVRQTKRPGWASDVRAWCAAKGIQVNANGRIPVRIVEMWEKEQKADQGSIGAIV